MVGVARPALASMRRNIGAWEGRGGVCHVWRLTHTKGDTQRDEYVQQQLTPPDEAAACAIAAPPPTRTPPADDGSALPSAVHSPGGPPATAPEFG